MTLFFTDKLLASRSTILLVLATGPLADLHFLKIIQPLPIT